MLRDTLQTQGFFLSCTSLDVLRDSPWLLISSLSVSLLYSLSSSQICSQSYSRDCNTSGYMSGCSQLKQASRAHSVSLRTVSVLLQHVCSLFSLLPLCTQPPFPLTPHSWPSDKNMSSLLSPQTWFSCTGTLSLLQLSVQVDSQWTAFWRLERIESPDVLPGWLLDFFSMQTSCEDSSFRSPVLWMWLWRWPEADTWGPAGFFSTLSLAYGSLLMVWMGSTGVIC